MPPTVDEITPSPTIKRSDTFVSETNNSWLADVAVPTTVDDHKPILPELQANLSSNPPETFRLSIDISTVHSERPEVKSARVATPRKAPVEEKVSVKVNSSFLKKARRWAASTSDSRYAQLLSASEETASQVPIRKTGTNLRKLPEIDAHILQKLVKEQSSTQVGEPLPACPSLRSFPSDRLSSTRATTHPLFSILAEHDLSVLNTFDTSAMQTRPTGRSRFLFISHHPRRRSNSSVFFLLVWSSAFPTCLEQLAWTDSSAVESVGVFEHVTQSDHLSAIGSNTTFKISRCLQQPSDTFEWHWALHQFECSPGTE